MSDLIIYGASGHARVLLDIAQSTGLKIAGFYDDNPTIEKLDTLKRKELQDHTTLIIAIGDNKIRKKLASHLTQYNFQKLIHNTAIIANDVIIDTGTVVMAGATINPATVVGKHAIINTGAILDHDGRIGDYTHISPGATLTGHVTIGVGTHIGANAVVIPGVTIGKWCVIGAGAVVLKDVPDFSTVVGNPGTIIKTHD